MEEKWPKFFAGTKYIDQKSRIIKICKYVFQLTMQMWREYFV